MCSLALSTTGVVTCRARVGVTARGRLNRGCCKRSATVFQEGRNRDALRRAGWGRHQKSTLPRRNVTSLAMSPSDTDPAMGMTPIEKYLFDLNGYVVVRGVFSAEEIQAANEAIDKRSKEIVERKGGLRLGGEKGAPLAGDGITGREDLGGMLGWQPNEDRELFRNVLTHNKLVPYYHELLGKGYRMDHLPLLIQQSPGADGFVFHGGRVNDDGTWGDDLAYTFSNGKMYNRLLAVSVALTETKPGDGGFCVIRGSHKANLPCPQTVRNYEVCKEFVENPALAPGDVLLFSEATTHGTLPWTSSHTRRACLYRFAPSTSAYGRAYMTGQLPEWPLEMTEGLTQAERSVLEPPYHPRLDRPSLQHDGTILVQSRADFKKEHDAKVFGSKYF